MKSIALALVAWVIQSAGTTASFRAISAVNASTVWASGTNGTYVQTADGGAIWKSGVVPGAEQLDFRGLHAFDPRTAILLSSGPGDKSRIYRTADGGAHWALQFTNADAKGFLDSIAFWDARHGIVLGDPVDGQFVILTTDDGGEHWNRQKTPPALPNEGAFAASNSCLTILGAQEVWFGTGGPGAARVFHSKDRGRAWSVAATPIRNDSASAGIFSLAFSSPRHGVAVGGDYNKPAESAHNIAITEDGGETWTEPASRQNGFRSAVMVAEGSMWIATGTSGSDVSTDNGATWRAFDTAAYNAIAAVSSKAIWAAGPKGALAKLKIE